MYGETQKLSVPQWCFFSAVIILGLLIRLSRLDAQSLWLDEVTSIQVAQRSLAEIIGGRAFNNHTPPLYYALLHVWANFIPLTEAGLRLPSALIDLVNMILLVHLSLRFIPHLNASLVVSAYALSPFMIYYSQEGRMYTLAVFFALAYSLALEKLCRTENHFIGWSLLSGILLSLGLYTHYYFLFFGSALILLALFVTRKSPKHFAAVCCSGVVALLLFSFWIPVILSLASSGGQPFRKFGLSIIPYAFFRFVVGYGVFPINMNTKLHFAEEVVAYAPTLILVSSVLALLGYYVIIVARGTSRSFILSVAWVVITPILIASVLSLRTPMLSERYFILLFPFFLLLLLGGLDLKRHLQKTAVGALLVLFVLGDFAYFTNPDFGKPQWRSAAEYVATITDRDIVFVEPGYATDVFKYYFKRPDNVFRLRPLKMAGGFQLDEEFEKVLRNHREVVIVSSGRFVDNGYARVLSKIAIERDQKIFPFDTGIACRRWEIRQDIASLSDVTFMPSRILKDNS